MELSIVIPALNEEENIGKLIAGIHRVLDGTVPHYEVIVVDGGSSDETANVASANGATVIHQRSRGYGGALKEGFPASRGDYILSLDADLSHDPAFISQMWSMRDEADLVIASRYIAGGSAEMSLYRKVLSRVLNLTFGRGLSLPVKDLSSGFRLYRSSCIAGIALEGNDFDILEEILIRCYAQGLHIREMPFHYRARKTGHSHVKPLKFGISFAKTFWHMWRLRNSIASADYDDRAHDSIVPLQRYWQRRRYAITTTLARGARSVLDIGCGSSRILSGLNDSVGVDIQFNKARYAARRYRRPVVNASVYALPFPDASFECVVCSQVIEHLPAGEQPFQEMIRVLQPGGALVIGTPDCGKLSWRLIEKLYGFFAPGGYADEHITHYTKDSLVRLLEQHDLHWNEIRYVGGSEMILQFEKRRHGQQ